MRWSRKTRTSCSRRRSEAPPTWPDFARNRLLLWTLFQQAKAWKKLPSELLHLGPNADWIDAYSIDQAVWSFGNALQSALDDSEKNCKSERQRTNARTRVFAQWLPEATAGTPRHRDPARESTEGVRR